MFPYPSGSGLHVGHVEGYTATDILARYKRAKGFNVLHPMGWDSFGLPAEQYAIRTGTHPAIIDTEQNINNFRRQLRAFGFSYDWDREFATSDPSYYKWTQWIFTKLYEKGLAYEAEMRSIFALLWELFLPTKKWKMGGPKKGDFPVERRPFRAMGIKNYRLRRPSDSRISIFVDWPESLKKLQINWIGKSEGATVHFKEKSTGEI